MNRPPGVRFCYRAELIRTITAEVRMQQGGNDDQKSAREQTLRIHA